MQHIKRCYGVFVEWPLTDIQENFYGQTFSLLEYSSSGLLVLNLHFVLLMYHSFTQISSDWHLRSKSTWIIFSELFGFWFQ